MIEIFSIPRERKAVLIGKNGSIKERIEKGTYTKIKIHEDVKIEGEFFNVVKAKNIVLAISRGFSPEKAFLLMDDSYELRIISLKEERENTVKRLMARVIGKKGAARRIIESETNTTISVYGKTVSIIGTLKNIVPAQEAVEALLLGSRHGHAYSRMKKKTKSSR